MQYMSGIVLDDPIKLKEDQHPVIEYNSANTRIAAPWNTSITITLVLITQSALKVAPYP